MRSISAVEPFAGDRFVVRHGWISSCSGRSVGGGFSSRRRIPIALDPGRSAAPHRPIMRRGFPRLPCSAEWTNVPLDVRSCSGSSCASRAAFVVLVPVVEVRPLDSVRAVCGACRILDEVLRRRPRRRRDPGLRLGSPIAWEVLFCRQSTCLGSLAGRPSGVRLADVDCSSGVTAALGVAGAHDGRAAPCVIGTRCLGSCSSRPSRQSVVSGSGSGRVVVRGLVGARRDAGWRIRLLDAGLLDVVRIPVLRFERHATT